MITSDEDTLISLNGVQGPPDLSGPGASEAPDDLTHNLMGEEGRGLWLKASCTDEAEREPYKLVSGLTHSQNHDQQRSETLLLFTYLTLYR